MLKSCKICNNKFLSYLSLGKHPCADTFLTSKKKALNLKKFPLIVGFCKCSHLSAIYPISSYIRYEKYDYSYTSDNSIVSRNHFRDMAKYISKNFRLNEDSLIVEAGSNDGTFLKEIKKFSKSRVLGVDPAKNISNLAKKKNLDTFTNYFNSKTSKKILKKYGTADIIYGANVFNHIDNIQDFLIGAKKLIKFSGSLILEIPDLNSLIEKVGFDTIYHEHRHYFSESSINKILNKNGFYIYQIKKINYMSGSLRVFASQNRVSKIKLRKVSIGQFNKFKKKAVFAIDKIKKFVKSNRPVVGIGAATKGNTLLNCCEFTDKDIKFILDRSDYKIDKFTPGSGIKIKKETHTINNYSALILPWNITRHLIKKKYLKNIKYTSIAKITKSL